VPVVLVAVPAAPRVSDHGHGLEKLGGDRRNGGVPAGYAVLSQRLKVGEDLRQSDLAQVPRGHLDLPALGLLTPPDEDPGADQRTSSGLSLKSTFA